MKQEFAVKLRVITHNIRYATQHPFKGEEPWTVRRRRILRELEYHVRHNQAFICLQEVLHDQLSDILDDRSGLNRKHRQLRESEWAYIGVGREDGKQAGEYAPILYRSAVWELKASKTTWLSKTPDRPSKDWDAASIRILTIGIFQHRSSKAQIIVMNTHLDDQGSESRFYAANIILREIEEMTDQGAGRDPLPVILAGDLNTGPDDEAYKILTSEKSSLLDARSVDDAFHYGHDYTYTGFGDENEQKQLLDYVFLGPKGKNYWEVEGTAVLESRFDDGVYSSDHRAVIADVLLNTSS